MKVLLMVLAFVLTIPIVSAQSKEYVCTPCGQTCDNVVHAKPGTCPSCHMKLVEKSKLQFKNLTADEFCKRISSQAILLDVRSRGEFNGSAWGNTYGAFKNAININIDDLEKRLSELEKYKNREILVYCSHSVRSPRAAMILTEHGFQNVKNLAGGVSTLKVKGNACLETNFIVHK
jgi:rhodanese-related sulfurtransferase